MEILRKVEQLKAELDAMRPLDPDREARVWQKLRLDWNYHSNKLEGNTYSYGETKMLLMKGLTAGGKPIRDHEEITGHNDAITFVIDSIKDGTPLTETFIRNLHTLTLVRDFWSEAKTSDGELTKRLIKVGVYKNEPNHVETQSGDIFRFAEPIETPAMMEELVRWYREQEESAEANPVLLAAEFHYRFVRIHPFGDGNGRVARLLMNFVLMKQGHPPVIIKTEDKDNYIAVLEQADFEILEPFVSYIAENLGQSLQLMLKGAKGEKIEDADDLEKELAILERQVRAVGKRVELRRNREAVMRVFEDSIEPLVTSYYSSSRAFDRFYVESHARLSVNGKAVLGEYDNAIHYGRQELDSIPEDGISSVGVVYNWVGFNQLEFGEFRYDSSLEIIFALTKYTVVSRMTGRRIERLYTEILSESDINEILDEEKRTHLNTIKERLEQLTKND